VNVDQIFDMIFDTSNNLFFNLSTTSSLTTTPGAYKEKLGGGTDLALFKFNQNAGCSDNLEDNNVKETAPEIVVSNNLNTYGISSKISSPSDEDWYKVVLLNKEPNLKISLLNLSVPMNIQLYNSSGVLLAQTEGSGLQDKTLVYNSTVGGTYYIYISHDSTANASTGCYRLQVIKSSTAFLKEWSSSSSASGITLQITPNLVISDLNLELTVPTDGITNFIITDALGRQMITISEDVTAGKNTCHQDVSKLAPGLYRVINRTGTVVTYNSFVISR
jgi:hypothetical protein